MRCLLRGAIVAFLFGAILAGVRAQAQPDVAEILKKVSATYKVDRYELEVHATVSGGEPATSHAQFAFEAPSKYRMQGTLLGMGLPQGGDMQIVADGTTLWMYAQAMNQYVSIPLSELARAPGDLGDAAPAAMDHFMMWRYRGAADFADGPKFLREETLEVAGAKIPCFVLTVKPPRSSLVYTWWIDKTRFRILREDDAGNSALFTTIRLGEPMADERFKFTPPPGARELELDK